MPKTRKKSSESLKPVLHIYCEGEKTEPNYIKGYVRKNFASTRLIDFKDSKKNTPKQLVEEAVRAKQQATRHPNYHKDDIFWVVYDRESEQKYSAHLHQVAYDKAAKHKIHIALSNVCFEVWLLLHFQNTVAPYSCYDDLRDHSPLRQECKKRGLADYDKGSNAIFALFSEEDINAARRRAKQLNRDTEYSADPTCTRSYQWNPYTNVNELLDSIDEFGEEHKLTRLTP